MASPLYILLAISLFFSLHSQARDLQSFNKDVAEPGKQHPQPDPQRSDPTFSPDNGNNYGLYRDNTLENGERPVKDLKNAVTNPVSYVNQPQEIEDIKDSRLSGENPADRFIYDNVNGRSGSAVYAGRDDHFPRGYSSRSRPQGMSDTRTLENGRYFYDVDAERFETERPYEAVKAAADGERYYYGDRRGYGNGFAGESSGAGEGGRFGQNEVNFGNWP